MYHLSFTLLLELDVNRLGFGRLFLPVIGIGADLDLGSDLSLRALGSSDVIAKLALFQSTTHNPIFFTLGLEAWNAE